MLEASYPVICERVTASLAATPISFMVATQANYRVLLSAAVCCIVCPHSCVGRLGWIDLQELQGDPATAGIAEGAVVSGAGRRRAGAYLCWVATYGNRVS